MRLWKFLYWISKLNFNEVKIMKYCNYMRMWRQDMEEDDIFNADCDGECEACCYCEEIKTARERWSKKN